MKEYIEKVLYNASGFIIGQNSKNSFILGQDNQWVVLDSLDIKKIKNTLSLNKNKGVFDGFNFTGNQNTITINQQGHTIVLDRSIFKNLQNK